MDAAVLRVSAHTGDVTFLRWPGADDGAERWRAWVTAAWAQEPVARAVALASPVLADRVEAMIGEQRPDDAQARRMAMALARYLSRMRGRATPFGTFAGVTMVRFGPRAAVQWTGCHQTRTRADAAWLAEVIAQLEGCAALRRRLTVVINDLTFGRGGRLVVPWQPHASRRGSIEPPDEVTVRYIAPVQTISLAARTPIKVGDLIDKLAADYSGVPVLVLDDMVAELVMCGALITNLRPPSTAIDALAYVLERLHEAQAASVPEIATLVDELRLIHAQLHDADSETNRRDGRQWRGPAQRMRGLSAIIEQPLNVDLRIGVDVILPSQVAVEAASAAEVLMRLTPAPAGHPAWREYHHRFLDRYGLGTMVPVELLVDATIGLGFPRHYGQPEHRVPGEPSGRDERLLTLAQQGALDGAREVVLDDNTLDPLAGAEEDGLPLPHADVRIDIRATTTTALTEGRFVLAVSGIGRTAATVGRFLDLLPGEDRQRTVGFYGRLPPRVDGALTAQLSYPPQHPRVENVLRVPLILPDVICLAEHRHGAPGQIPVQDLAVTADLDRLYLVSLSQRRVVETFLPHAGARHTMPLLGRMLFELPQAAGPAISPFAWGAATCLPFRPRIRYGRTILAPAQWRFHPAELPSPAASVNDWFGAMATMREQRHIPASVSVGSADRRLRLDLDDPMDLTLLRAHLDGSKKAVTVSEAPTADEHGWLDGRAHEIVISLAATASPTPPPATVTCAAQPPLIGREHGVLPGSGLLSAKLYGHPDVFDTILTCHLPDVLATFDEHPPWWFVRYTQPTHHLRLRLHVPDFGHAASQIGMWAADLRRLGLIGDLAFDTYRPEIGRYGHGPAMAAAEALFAADSTAVLAQLTAAAGSKESHPQALTAASLVDLACAVTGSRTEGMRWLVDHPELASPAPVRDRGVLRQAIRLADGSALGNLPGGPAVAAAWQTRSEAAFRYATCLTPDATRVTARSVLLSLLHLHHVRALGVDPDAEAATYKLARAIALFWDSRQSLEAGRR